MLKKDFINLSFNISSFPCLDTIKSWNFWDDWVWSNNYIELHKASSEIGFHHLQRYLIFFSIALMYNLFSKFIILLLYLATGIIFRKILDHFDIIKLQEKYYLSIFFLISPLNMTRKLIMYLQTTH